jgi:hypothetical protein
MQSASIQNYIFDLNEKNRVSAGAFFSQVSDDLPDRVIQAARACKTRYRPVSHFVCKRVVPMTQQHPLRPTLFCIAERLIKKNLFIPVLRLCNMPHSGYPFVERMPDGFICPVGATLNIK